MALNSLVDCQSLEILRLDSDRVTKPCYCGAPAPRGGGLHTPAPGTGTAQGSGTRPYNTQTKPRLAMTPTAASHKGGSPCALSLCFWAGRCEMAPKVKPGAGFARAQLLQTWVVTLRSCLVFKNNQIQPTKTHK